jgi:hypothetical protein
MVKYDQVFLKTWSRANKNPLEKISICMNRVKQGWIFKNIWMTKRKVRWIRGGKGSNYLSSGTFHNHIGKCSKNKMSPI